MKTFKQNKKRHITIERNYYLGEKIGVLNCSQALLLETFTISGLSMKKMYTPKIV